LRLIWEIEELLNTSHDRGKFADQQQARSVELSRFLLMMSPAIFLAVCP
jgi:hypothetical protein